MKPMRRSLMIFTVAGAMAACDSTTATTTDAGTVTDLGAGSDAATGLVVVSGNFSDGAAVVAGGTVEVVGASPALSTTTSATGAWSLMIPAGRPVFIRGSKTGYRSVQVGFTVPAAGLAGLALDVVSNELAAQLFSTTGVTENTAAGVLAVNFTLTGDGGTLPTNFGVNLSGGGGTRIALGGGGGPTVRDTTLGGEHQEMIILNVAAGMTTVTPVVPAGFTCTPSNATLTTVRVDPRVITFAAFDCH